MIEFIRNLFGFKKKANVVKCISCDWTMPGMTIDECEKERIFDCPVCGDMIYQ